MKLIVFLFLLIIVKCEHSLLQSGKIDVDNGQAIMNVKVTSAVNLHCIQSKSDFCHPYFSVYLSHDDKRQTSSQVKCTRNPYWNATMMFTTPNCDNNIHIQVFQGPTKDFQLYSVHNLLRASVVLDQKRIPSGQYEIWIMLDDKEGSQNVDYILPACVKVQFQYKPQTCVSSVALQYRNLYDQELQKQNLDIAYQLGITPNMPSGQDLALCDDMYVKMFETKNQNEKSPSCSADQERFKFEKELEKSTYSIILKKYWNSLFLKNDQEIIKFMENYLSYLNANFAPDSEDKRNYIKKLKQFPKMKKVKLNKNISLQQNSQFLNKIVRDAVVKRIPIEMGTFKGVDKNGQKLIPRKQIYQKIMKQVFKKKYKGLTPLPLPQRFKQLASKTQITKDIRNSLNKRIKEILKNKTVNNSQNDMQQQKEQLIKELLQNSEVLPDLIKKLLDNEGINQNEITNNIQQVVNDDEQITNDNQKMINDNEQTTNDHKQMTNYNEQIIETNQNENQQEQITESRQNGQTNQNQLINQNNSLLLDQQANQVQSQIIRDFKGDKCPPNCICILPDNPKDDLQFIPLMPSIVLPINNSSNFNQNFTNATEKINSYPYVNVESQNSLQIQNTNCLDGYVCVKNNQNSIEIFVNQQIYLSNFYPENGMQLIVIKRNQNYTKQYEGHYDTYFDKKESEKLVNDINKYDESFVFILTSRGLWNGALTQNLKDLIQLIGGPNLNQFNDNKQNFALIGRKNLCENNAFLAIDSQQVSHNIDMDEKFSFEAPTITSITLQKLTVTLTGIHLAESLSNIKKIQLNYILCQNITTISSQATECSLSSQLTQTQALSVVYQLTNGKSFPTYKTCPIHANILKQNLNGDMELHKFKEIMPEVLPSNPIIQNFFPQQASTLGGQKICIHTNFQFEINMIRAVQLAGVFCQDVSQVNQLANLITDLCCITQQLSDDQIQSSEKLVGPVCILMLNGQNLCSNQEFQYVIALPTQINDDSQSTQYQRSQKFGQIKQFLKSSIQNKSFANIDDLFEE